MKLYKIFSFFTGLSSQLGVSGFWNQVLPVGVCNLECNNTTNNNNNQKFVSHGLLGMMSKCRTPVKTPTVFIMTTPLIFLSPCGEQLHCNSLRTGHGHDHCCPSSNDHFDGDGLLAKLCHVTMTINKVFINLIRMKRERGAKNLHFLWGRYWITWGEGAVRWLLSWTTVHHLNSNKGMMMARTERKILGAGPKAWQYPWWWSYAPWPMPWRPVISGVPMNLTECHSNQELIVHQPSSPTRSSCRRDSWKW